MKGIPPREYTRNHLGSPQGSPLGGSTGNTRETPRTRTDPPPRLPHSPTTPHYGSPPLPRPSRGRVNPRGFHGGTRGEYGRYRGSRGVKPAFNEVFPGNSANFATFSSRETPCTPRGNPWSTPENPLFPGPPGASRSLPELPEDTPRGHTGPSRGLSKDTPGGSLEAYGGAPGFPGGIPSSPGGHGGG